MQIDIESLRDFYATPLGQVVRRLIGRKVRARWRHVSGGFLVGFGFATPYLSVFKEDVDRLGALMPARQGALVWPRQGLAKTVLIDEDNLPLPDNSVDRLLIVHGLESAGHQRQLLRELWRVLSPNGCVLLVVPNRRGLWTRTDRTPFGFGNPFTRSQLESLLLDAMFTPVYWDTALHVPPLHYRFFHRSAVAWERLGNTVIQPFAGVHIVEARKELAAPTGVKKARRVSYDTVLQPTARQTNQTKSSR